MAPELIVIDKVTGQRINRGRLGLYVFDEGHHLADKALKHFSFHARVAATSADRGERGSSVAPKARGGAGVTVQSADRKRLARFVP